MDVAKFNRALEAALVFLGRAPDGARFRLRDILVEEVSFVDRAANRRRFLIVKQRGGNMDPTRTATNDVAEATLEADVAAVAKVDLPGPVKEGLLRIVTEALERLVSVSNMVKEAGETSETSAEPVPAELGEEITAISDLLRGALSRYPSPMSKTAEKVDKADGPVSQGLKEVGEIAMSLSAAAAESDELDAATLSQVRALAAKLNALAEKYPQPTAGEAPAAVPDLEVTAETKADVPEEPEAADGAPSGDEDTAPAADPPSAEPAVEEKAEGEAVEVTAEEMDEKLSSVGSETADKLKVLAEAMTRIANAPDPAELVRIRDEIVGLSKSLESTVAKGGADKLARVLDAVRRAISIIDEAGAPAAPAAPGEDAQKRAAATEPLPPESTDGGPGSVGSGPDDKPVREGDDLLAGIMKKLDAVTSKVEEIAGTPQVPASRAEPGGRSNGTRATREQRRGGPWVL